MYIGGVSLISALTTLLLTRKIRSHRSGLTVETRSRLDFILPFAVSRLLTVLLSNGRTLGAKCG